VDPQAALESDAEAQIAAATTPNPPKVQADIEVGDLAGRINEGYQPLAVAPRAKYPRLNMSKEALVGAVKEIVTLARSGDAEGSFDGYKALFTRPDFTANRPEDMRQALKLLILAKRTGPKSEKLIEAHRAAIAPLTDMVSKHNEPEDYEMLGICHLLIGNEKAAANMFQEGLTLERAKNAGSDLCGRLMTRVSSL